VNFNVTSHPTAGWIIQQLREAFPYQSAPRFLIFDRDAKYGLEVPIAVRSMASRGSKRAKCQHRRQMRAEMEFVRTTVRYRTRGCATPARFIAIDEGQ